ncbi:MAG: VWA domain-containing protein [Kofleriaceae bacterium]
MNPATDVISFGRALRDAGVAVGIHQLEAFARALPLIDASDRRALFCAARATLITRHEDLTVFGEEFAKFFDGEVERAQKMPMAPRHDRMFVKTALGAYMAEKARASDPEVEMPENARAASSLEQLQTKDFAICSADERQAIARMLEQLDLQVAQRRSLRRVPSKRGRELDLAAAVRSSARHAGKLFALPRRQHKWKPRPIVVLADISGSMELYTRIVLQFLHALSSQHPTEVFVFGTRLTRITPQLALTDLDRALDRAAAEIHDYAGGTRIGECLHAFERAHARRVVRRGAIVLVISDGLETGDAKQLAREVRRLHDRAYRLIWLNPLLGAARYRPVAEGMAAALPYVDDFLPVRDLRSLESLARHLAAIPRRKGAVR